MVTELSDSAWPPQFDAVIFHPSQSRGCGVYGTPAGFTVSAKPSSALYADAAAEYSVSGRWVLALDATYRTQVVTRVIGTDPLYTSGALRVLDASQSNILAFAPDFKYNWKSTIGVILGTRIVAAGRNISYTVTPAVVVNLFTESEVVPAICQEVDLSTATVSMKR